jgi:hypothetical protein
MRKALILIFIVAMVTLGGYAVTYWCATGSAKSMLTKPGGEMEWLRREYHLNEVQFARVQQLHHQYAPKCDLMCAHIAKANARLNQLIDTNKKVTPEVTAAMAECLAAQEECREAMLGHVYAVSAEMSPEDGARYLQMMKAQIVEPALPHSVAISNLSR